ncbi:Cytochrome P450 [Parafrankia irregularis]|uniref:Cytochrome P450 n=1 Tax=Parafrankia irregularis TaxID=795642 RepID=A0A0S4QGB5_9ACTN|nr:MULTISPECIES: cytochrome P450 [Parafrankia]MBE3201024.1 cytochrome P450 [Parafrankia sp. CH37]CUU54577.1 Cytochrome P450 [Parafrankia irregularis]
MSDLETPDYFRDAQLVADPYPFLEQMRDRCPVLREDHHDVVMVTGYEEAVEVFHDSATFSSCTSVTGPFPGFPVPLEGDDVTALIEAHRHELPMSDQLPVMDPPTHTAHRALLMRLITPKRLKENEAQIWNLVDQMLDPYLASGEGDYISGFAGPFTLLIIADLLGVPEEDQEEFLDRLQRRPESQSGIGSTGDDHLAHNPLEFLYNKFTAYIEDRRAEPRDDVLTGLAQATFPDGSTPEVIDAVRVAANLFSAGQETTVRLLSSALKILAEDPELQDLLRSEPERVGNFIEETLRLESPVKGDFRLSRVPTTVGGVDLPAGTTVMVVNGAANRDPRRFENPNVFDVARPNARHHVAFGRGIHTCPGAPLARAETRAAIERILERTTEIRVSESVHGPAGDRRYSYLPTFILRGLTHLNLEFTLAPRNV